MTMGRRLLAIVLLVGALAGPLLTGKAWAQDKPVSVQNDEKLAATGLATAYGWYKKESEEYDLRLVPKFTRVVVVDTKSSAARQVAEDVVTYCQSVLGIPVTYRAEQSYAPNTIYIATWGSPSIDKIERTLSQDSLSLDKEALWQACYVAKDNSFCVIGQDWREVVHGFKEGVVLLAGNDIPEERKSHRASGKWSIWLPREPDPLAALPKSSSLKSESESETIPYNYIILSASATRAELFAAEELREYLWLLFAKQLTVAVDDGAIPAKSILLGVWRNHPSIIKIAEKANLTGNFQECGEEGYWLQSVPEESCFLVVGNRSRGVLYGVYALLKEMQCRWFMPGPLGEVLPNHPRWPADDFVKSSSPAYSTRGVIFHTFGPGNEEIIDWCAKNGVNLLQMQVPAYVWDFSQFRPLIEERDMDIEAGHHPLGYWLPPAIYRKEHPEYFALMPDGKRHHFQVCPTQPGVVDIVTGRMLGFLDVFPEVNVVGFYPEDGNDVWCTDEGCTAIDPADSSSKTDTWLSFINRVTDKVNKVKPDQKVNTIAYLKTLYPSTQTVPGANVTMSVAQALPQWGEVYQGREEDLYGYRYYMYYFSNRTLIPFYLYREGVGANSLPFEAHYFRQWGYGGVATQVARENWGTYQMNYYLFAELFWDPDRKVSTLMEDYCRKMYGPAAQEVLGFYNKLAEAYNVVTQKQGSPWLWMRMTTDGSAVRYGEPLMSALRGMDVRIKQAMSISTDETACKRLKQLEVASDYLRLQVSLEVNYAKHEALKKTNPDQAKEHLQKVLDDFRKFKELSQRYEGAHIFHGKWSREAFYKTLEGK